MFVNRFFRYLLACATWRVRRFARLCIWATLIVCLGIAIKAPDQIENMVSLFKSLGIAIFDISSKIISGI